MARSKNRRSHRRTHYYENPHREKKRSSFDYETVRRLSFRETSRQVDDEPRRKSRPDFYQTVVRAPATKAAVYAFDPFRVDPSRVVRTKELNCRQKSQRSTEKPKFSSGGVSKLQWAISRKQREERCK